MPTTRDYYEILSIEKTADGEEVKRAYRRMAMKFHPDRNPGDAEAETKFKEAAEAYEVLSDPQKKARYDQYGHEGLRGGGAAGHDFSRMDVNDIFSMFSDLFDGMGGMGGQRGGRRGQSARGFDLETEVVISLEDVLKGCDRDVEFDRLDVCDTCTGSGAKPGTKPVKCGTCGGQGRVQQSGMGGMFRMVVACPDCRGSGQFVKEQCTACRGRGRVPKRRKLGVKIPPGIQHGQAIRVQGEGEPPGPEMSPSGAGIRGDLHVGVRVKEHEVFKREGDHLVVEVPVTFTQAVLGAEIEVPSLDGARKLTIPRGTQHGTLFRIGQAGLPNLRSARRGDLAIISKIEVPKKLTSRQEELLREFGGTEDEKLLPETHKFFKKVKGWLGH